MKGGFGQGLKKIIGARVGDTGGMYSGCQLLVGKFV